MARAPQFDQATLAAAGLTAVQREGWAGISIRSVAAEVGVSPMALYRLVPDADALRLLIADRGAPPVSDDVVGPDLATILGHWARDTYASLERYPGLAGHVIAHWTEMPRWLDIVETMLTAAADHELTGAEAVPAVNAVFAYVLVRAEMRDAASAGGRRALRPLRDDPDRYPLIGENRAAFATRRVDTHFEFGLAALTAGLGLSERRTSDTGPGWAPVS